MKKLIALIAILVPGSVFAAGGGITPRNVGVELRTQKFCVDSYQAVADADVTRGASGVAMIAAQAVGTPYYHIVQTSSIGALPYPSKVLVGFVDSSNNSGPLSCASTVLVGFDQFGNKRTETFSGTSSVTEVAEESRYVYASVVSVSATNCSSTGHTSDGTDYLRVRAGTEIGLPFKIVDVKGAIQTSVQKICVQDASASDIQICMRPSTSDGTLTFDAQTTSSRVDAAQSSVELSGNVIANGAAIADDDDICVTVVAPAGQ